jgi:DNA topoisomerase-1
MPKRLRRRRNGLGLVTDPVDSAKQAGLRYVSDARPGITRRRAGARFSYVDAAGRAVRDAKTLARIKRLAIPPAWRDVWICPHEGGHLQAVGRDARGRKQYRYHPRWRRERDQTKYNRMLVFAEALPRIRACVDEDLGLPGLPRAKVLATVVRLLETTLIRIGNEEYARDNGSFGLTTLRTRHVDVTGATLRFRFRAKGGRIHEVGMRDPRVARVVRRCQELPGQELFQYVDESGELRTIDSADVNDYVREASGDDFTAKDFRTWAGTVLAALALAALGPVTGVTRAKRNVNEAITAVAAVLRNTPTICRKCYVHPVIIESYLDGDVLNGAVRRAVPGLKPEEAAVAALLAKRLARTPAAA